MPRYFIEVSYRGTGYSGFQIQENAVTIQSEVEKALKIYYRKDIALTGSSRTDAGVHALQNYFHFDLENPLALDSHIKKSKSFMLSQAEDFEIKGLYNLNAILPGGIVIKRIFQVEDDAHCRFGAVSREYKYFIYQNKNPFIFDRAYYFPYILDLDKLNEAAELLLKHKNFTSFSKKNTQVNNFICELKTSEWLIEDDTLIYHVVANRFLRGMVKGLVGTMLKVGTHKLSLDQFNELIQNRDCSNANFSVPSHALFLIKVSFNSF